jgi:membrane fusion protein (multidrug efflux system)
MDKKNIAKVLILLLLIIVGGIWIFKKVNHSLHYESTDNAQIETTTTPVLARISGYVDSIAITDYAAVNKGDVLVKIDPHEYEIALAQAEADLLQSKADLENAQAGYNNATQNVKVAATNVDLAKIRLQKAETDFQRDSKLFADQSITQKQLEDSKTNFELQQKSLTTAIEQTKLANTSLNVYEAQKRKAEAILKMKQAAIDNAKLKLSYTTITAPESGKIGKCNVQPGQYLQPGQALFTIVNDDNFWVVANFKETQIENMKEGQAVEIKLDAYPNQKIEGTISSLSEATGAKFSLLPPDNASGNFIKVTQRVPVRIAINNISAIKSLLKAGLSAEVEVKVK